MRTGRRLITATIFWYLLGAFVGATWDITEWAPEGRLIIAILWVASVWAMADHDRTNRDGTED